MCRLIYLISLFIFLTLNLQAQNRPNILILHSYHPTYKWSDDIQKGIDSVFKSTRHQYNFYVEYMDTKRFVSQEHYEQLQANYINKYKNIDLDLIILSDNNALNFVKQHHQNIFKKAPVVFTGINYFNKKDIEGFENFTGVNEQADIKINYQLIKTIHPEVKTIYTIIDNTTTGLKTLQEVQKIVAQKNDQIEYKILSNISIENLKKTLKNMPQQSAILITVFFRDNQNKFFEYYEVSRMIAKETKAPLYGLWDFYLENGIIGGFLTSGLFQGIEAAKMAQKILNGIPAGSIPVKQTSPNEYMFDYKELEKFNITIDNLPKSSYIINQPSNFYQTYKKEILTVLVILIVLIVVVILLLFILYQKQSTQIRIKKELHFQQTLMDTVDAPIYYKDIQGEYIGCNKAFEEFLHTTKESIIGHTVFELLPNEVASLYNKKDKEIIENPHTQNYEGIHTFPDGSQKNLIFYKNVYYDENEEVQGIVGTIFDITELKNITKELNILNKNLEAKVEERTAQLQETVIDLENTQKRLVEIEVMHSLGNLVAGVAHEINTPIGIGITASSTLHESIKKLNSLYKDENMSEEEFEEFLTKSQELSLLINNNLDKTAKLIKSFKEVSTENIVEDRRVINIKEHMTHIIQNIKNITKYSDDININLHIEPQLNVKLFSGAFSQIMTNLILNAIHHAFEDKEKGQIDIEITHNNNQLDIQFKDNGAGIKEENLSKIFEPFFTTSRIKGRIGLGLNVLYNIITIKFNGSIECESTYEKETIFKIKLLLE